ncbi:hypothetical protein GF360_02320 [candidate division WWE3 bacterium]|nr:hypothetical protein [candidate division WWE3 bacterium]
MISFKKWRKKQLKDPKFKKSYEDLEEEFDEVKASIEEALKRPNKQKAGKN